MALDDHQQIIEVVRYASGQPAHGLHLLCVAQRFLGLFPADDLRFQFFVAQLCGFGHVNRQCQPQGHDHSAHESDLRQNRFIAEFFGFRPNPGLQGSLPKLRIFRLRRRIFLRRDGSGANVNFIAAVVHGYPIILGDVLQNGVE